MYCAYRAKTVVWFAAIGLATIAASGCKPRVAQQNANREESSQRPARWVAQYRPARSLTETGNYLALYSFNSISIVSRDVICVAADVPDPNDKTRRLALVVRTTDGGQTWNEISLASTGFNIQALNSIHFANPSTGVAVGVDSDGAGLVFNTTDGGVSWSGSRLSFKQIPTSVWLQPSGAGWIGATTSPSSEEEENEEEGGPSDILGTSDFGRSWVSQTHVPVSITALSFADDRTGWAGGNPAAIYHTTDGGHTWDRQRTELERGEGIPQVTGVGAKQFQITGIGSTDIANGWAAARSETEREGRMLGTTNGGKTWSQLWITNIEKLRAVFFINPMEGWATSDDGRYVYHTGDGGHSWLSEPIVFVQNVPLYDIAASDPSHVWAVGGGGIFRRVTE
jgi:photosystem II stability/assembly factor-like uncharacterized protein